MISIVGGQCDGIRIWTLSYPLIFQVNKSACADALF
jgi:hypothetical protein